MTDALHHHAQRMRGRHPNEKHRVATPLELLFDLTFATCFSLAASQLADALAAGRYAAALLGFGFASFAICWAWINFSWFSSAYDTDDWLFRVVTMLQMVGVLVLATGLPRTFASIGYGRHFDNSAMVLGYVVMRVALVFQWWVYFLVPSGQNVERHRDRAFTWGCCQMLIVTSIVATGEGLQVAADSIEHTARITAIAAVLAVAVPVVVFLVLLHALYYYLVIGPPQNASCTPR